MKPYYSKKVIEHFINPKNFGKIKNADGVGKVGNPRCVPPETLLFSNPSIKTIRDMRIRDRVVGHDGRFHKVKNIFKRNFNGKLLSIIVHNLGKTQLTHEHPVLCLKTSKVLRKFKEYKQYFPEWHRAEDLEKGDIILYPILQEYKDIKSIPFNIKKLTLDYSSRELPEEVKVDDSFLRLVGYYLAEGYANTKPCAGTLGFSFAEQEKKYINDVISIVKNIFWIKSSKIYIERNSARVNFYSARLARFFKQEFGSGALNKHLPDRAITLPPEKQAHILSGLWRGDGYVNPKRAMFVTISKLLARQIEILLLRQKMIFSFLIEPAYGIHKESYRFYIQDRASLEKLIRITESKIKIFNPEKKKNNPHSWFDGNYYYATIRKIIPQAFKGVVYNLEVAGSQSFITNSLALHNCGDVMELFIKVEKKKDKEIIKDIKFSTMGCAAAIATSDMICDLVKGKTLDEASKIGYQDIADELGQLPPVKIHCSVLAQQGLKAAIEDYKQKSKV